jgi:hypothetical protein
LNFKEQRMSELSYIDRLMVLPGAKQGDPVEEKAFLDEVQKSVIPAILQSEERQRALVHSMRVRPFSISRR